MTHEVSSLGLFTLIFLSDGEETVLFRFYCDVSYDGSSHQKIKGKTHDPTTLVFAGLVGMRIYGTQLKRSGLASISITKYLGFMRPT
jgi:hypothetical protein